MIETVKVPVNKFSKLFYKNISKVIDKSFTITACFHLEYLLSKYVSLCHLIFNN